MSYLPATNMIRSLLQRSGYFSTTATPEADLAAFLPRLRPFETNKPLVRVGAPGDGGYLVPDDLAGIDHCFSPGVSVTSVFEEDLLRRGIKSFLADASVNGPPASLREYVFDKKFLGSFEGETHMTLTSWVNKYLPEHKKDLVLQMDIEGGEYPVLLETPRSTLRRFRIVIIEFHFVEQLMNRTLFPLLREAFGKILQDFTVVHIHPNNAKGVNRLGSLWVPNLLEITFLRNDRITDKKPARQFPHPLDCTNMTGIDDIVLPACWYETPAAR